jgi:hypothetical protein
MHIEYLEKEVTTWRDINAILHECSNQSPLLADLHARHQGKLKRHNTAFITYDYGIDGVSIEISKYARCLEELFRHGGREPVMHFIGGNFFDEADKLLKHEWKRLAIREFDGWDKWDDGIWFRKLFYENMPEESDKSEQLAREIWRQAAAFARELYAYIIANNIGLTIPVNVNSNPGNVAASLAVILATELSGTAVLNSNHDFYWEGGKPLSKREEHEPPGVRDHFFTNYENREFFKVFKKLYPWNGKHWLQLTINRRQSRRLIKKYGFSRKRVRELNTAVSDSFFVECDSEEKMRKRLAMAYILSDGSPLITPVPVSRFLKQTGEWMKHQKPVLCGSGPGNALNIAGCSTWYLLQPTRVIPRKRIHHNLRLIGRLLALPDVIQEFEQNRHRQLVLHVSGPVPMEHERYLRRILKAYQALIRTLPGHMAKRVFIAFSAGGESHPVFSEYGLHSLHIRDIYQLADLILFPSETEGRGLPLIESGATGIPIVSRRYKPHRVFDEVVGAHLPEKLRIQFIQYPAHEITDECVRDVADALLDPASTEKMIVHNRNAVSERYSMNALENTFHGLLKNI